MSSIHLIASQSKTISRMSTCDRLQVGAIFFDNDYYTLGSGFNEQPNNKLCGRDGHVLNDKGGCIGTVHAEMSAWIDAEQDGESVFRQNLFITHMPCYYCSKILIELKLKKIYYIHDYVSKGSYGSGKELILSSDTELIHYS